MTPNRRTPTRMTSKPPREAPATRRKRREEEAQRTTSPPSKIAALATTRSRTRSMSQPPTKEQISNEGSARHHPGAGRLREELRADGDRRLHVQGPPERQQAGDPRRGRGDLGRRGAQSQHAQPQRQSLACASQQPVGP